MHPANVNAYNKILKEKVKARLRSQSLHASLHSKMLRTADHLLRSGSAAAPRAVWQVLQQELTVIVNNILQQLYDATEAAVRASYTDVRNRLFDRMREEPTGWKAGRFDYSIMNTTFRRFGSMLADLEGQYRQQQQHQAAGSEAAGSQTPLAEVTPSRSSSSGSSKWRMAQAADLPRITKAQDEIKQAMVQINQLLIPSKMVELVLQHAVATPLCVCWPPAIQRAAEMLAQQGSTPKAVRTEDWMGPNLVTSDELLTFVNNLQDQGLVLQDVGSQGNNCLIHTVMTQVLGFSDDEVAQQARQQLADKLQQEQLQGGQGLLTSAILSWHNCMGCSSTAEEQQQVLENHLTGVRGAAMLCDMELAVLASVVQEQYSMQLELFSPKYSGPGNSNVLTDPIAASEATVRIAHVDAAWLQAYQAKAELPTACQLNHFVVVRDARPGDESGRVTGGVSGGQLGGPNTRKRAAGASGGNPQQRLKIG